MNRLLISLVLVGITHSAFALTQIEGQDLLKQKNILVSSEDKKGLVVVFLSAKCPCSNSHVVEVQKLSQEYAGFQFVAVHSNTDESIELSTPYFEKAGFGFPVIEDHKTKLADELRALKTPHAFVFLANGDKVYEGGVSNSQDCGRADRLYLREALEDLQANRKIRTPEGRTLGCVITRGEKNVW